MRWLDLLLVDNELDLRSEIDGLDADAKNALVNEFAAVLGIDADELLASTLRLLIERARPTALPAALWRRPLTATSSVRDLARIHLEKRNIDPTDARLRRMQDLYARFAAERTKRVSVTETALAAQSYACGICGLRFYNEELLSLGFVSPLGNRPRSKTDALKPHWSRADYRRPTIEHVWPVSSFGNNSARNLVVACRGCNEGKSNYMAVHQTKPFVGMPTRRELRDGGHLSTEAFFAQMMRKPRCETSGKSALDSELTVGLRDVDEAIVLDNLVTVASAD